MNKDLLSLSGVWSRHIGAKHIDNVAVPGSSRPCGQYVLEREFELPWYPDDAEGRVHLRTDGVLAQAEFSVNCVSVGTAGPWVPYSFELPAGLLRRKNVIRAAISDIQEVFGPAPGRRFDSGLVRAIWLELTPQASIGTFSFQARVADDFSRADCMIDAKIDGPSAGRVEAELAEMRTGRTVACAAAAPGEPVRFSVDWPLLWSPETPHLYTLTVRLTGDRPHEVSDLVGFRRIDADGPDLFLNGERIVLRGVCRHEFTSAHGYSPPASEVRRELALIKHSGFNYVRLVHSPQSGIVPRIAAELGLLVTEEPGTCWHDLSDPEVAAPALEALRRTVLRDRNCPSVLAWFIYNECEPCVEYAVEAARVCREIVPDCRLSFADATGRADDLRAMADAAGLSFYGMNVYDFGPKAYVDRMAALQDRPFIVTEWGGWIGQGNPHLLKDLCRMFVRQSRRDASVRHAGCSYWVWADYEEYSRAEPAAIDGWTVEGLTGKGGNPKADLAMLSRMCFEMANPREPKLPEVRVLAKAPARAGSWQPVLLDDVAGDQSELEARIPEHYPLPNWPPNSPDIAGELARRVPPLGRLTAGGIEFRCRQSFEGEEAILLGSERPEVVIPVGVRVRAVAVLGNVALQGGYPASEVSSVFHDHAEHCRAYGEPAAEYVFEFEDGEVVQPLRHGEHVLRSNNICRWWKTEPRAPETAPAVEVEVHPSYEVLRVDLWERDFGKARLLKAIRWHLEDDGCILALYAVSVLSCAGPAG
jgi:hypothetical protein